MHTYIHTYMHTYIIFVCVIAAMQDLLIMLSLYVVGKCGLMAVIVCVDE
jgi:hypothetical protein